VTQFALIWTGVYCRDERELEEECFSFPRCWNVSSLVGNPQPLSKKKK